MVSGCAVERLQLPNFDEAERSDDEVTDPVDYPMLCEIPNWDTACWQAFEVFEDIAEDNKEIAQINADIARDSDAAYDSILAGAKKQQQIGEIREEMLEAERKDHFFDNIWHRTLIAILAIGLML